MENVLVSLHSLKTMGLGFIIFKEWSYLDILLNLITEKSKAEVYLGSMESKHATRFTCTRKKRAKK